MKDQRIQKIIREIIDRHAKNPIQPNFSSEAFRAKIAEDIWGAIKNEVNNE